MPRQPALEPARGVEAAEAAARDDDVEGHGGEATPPARRAASSAGRIALRQPAPHAPGGAREGVVGHGGEALLVLAQGEQQVRDPIRGRQLGIRRRDAEAVHAPAARRHEQRARLAHEPDAELAALEREAGAALELALVVAEQVAEEALGDRLAAPALRAPFGRTTLAPRKAYSSGMIQACANAASATGAASGSSQTITTPAATNGTV